MKYQVDKLMLFGSRAKGTSWERSDIDLAVSGLKTAMDFLDFQDEIEEIPTLLMFDIVDLDSDMINLEIRKAIAEEGVVLYEKGP